jgi:hypothetical protein
MQPIGNGTRLTIRCAKPSVDGLIARWKSRGKIDMLTDIFEGLYVNADETLNQLARPDSNPANA